MKHPQTLPSPLKIAAQVDAALAAAGLTGPQVERESIPLYLSFIEEMIDAQGKLVLNFQHSSPRDIAKQLVSWAQEEVLNEQGLLSCVDEHIKETLLLTKAHGTLSEIKRRKLLNLNQQIVGFISLFFSQATIKTRKSVK
ncbi:MAG: hypothetical protein ACI910_001740 [Oleispira sp.]|jgi:hypothetical protein